MILYRKQPEPLTETDVNFEQPTRYGVSLDDLWSILPRELTKIIEAVFEIQRRFSSTGMTGFTKIGHWSLFMTDLS